MAIIKSFIVFLIVLTLFWVIGSLCAADFDIKNWDSGGRVFCFAFGGILALVLAGLVYDNES